MADELERCGWSDRSGIEKDYHDREWGVPRRDDQGQFEFLTLEAAQAGLSWLTILNKREGYRQAFAGFDPLKVASYTDKDVERLMQYNGIIRNRKKIEAAINNAQCFLALAEKHGSFANYLWAFVDGRPLVNRWSSMQDLPASTPLSERISKDLKKHGFKFMGPIVVYSHLQATGLINDHLLSCFRHQELCSAT